MFNILLKHGQYRILDVLCGYYYYYIWRIFKNELCQNNRFSKEEHKENIKGRVSSISVQEFPKFPRNMFMGSEKLKVIFSTWFRLN
jgi:hypothetical protein